jgi:hypothetical protein
MLCLPFRACPGLRAALPLFMSHISATFNPAARNSEIPDVANKAFKVLDRPLTALSHDIASRSTWRNASSRGFVAAWFSDCRPYITTSKRGGSARSRSLRNIDKANGHVFSVPSNPSKSSLVIGIAVAHSGGRYSMSCFIKAYNIATVLIVCGALLAAGISDVLSQKNEIQGIPAALAACT